MSLDLPVILRTQELYISVSRLTEKLPALKRQTLGRRLEDTLLNLLEYLIMAGHAPKSHKTAYLIKATALVELANFHIRIMLDENLANITTLHQLQSKLSDLERQISGWRKSTQ